MTDINGKRVFYPLLFIILSGLIIYNIVHITSNPSKSKVDTYKVTDGWGFKIVVGKKVMIDQPFIPLLPGKIPFPDKKSASNTGKLIVKRIQDHTLPVITLTDLANMGIDTTGNQP